MTNNGTCDRCEGCGRIANDDDGTPWKYWEDLPVKSALAVIIGIVRPLPCPACGGTGQARVICELCGKPIERVSLGQKLHDGCWELKTRVERDPDLAMKVLAQLGLAE